MKVSEARLLFSKANEEVNAYFQSSLQTNFIHPLADMPAEDEVPRDFLAASDSVLSNASFRLNRNAILSSVIKDLQNGSDAPKHAQVVSDLKAFQAAYKVEPARSSGSGR